MTTPPKSFVTNQRPAKKPTPPRVKRRRRLLWWTALPGLLLFLLGVHLAALNSNFADAMAHYEADEAARAYLEFGDMRSPNFVDPWKAHFNTGTAAYANDSHFAAASSLEKALESVPAEHRCDVQTNLSLTYEALGDRYRERGDAELEWAIAQAAAEIARAQGDPYDPDLFELDYNDEEITSADRFADADWLLYVSADYYAAAATALGDPTCQTPPSPDASPEEQEEHEQEQSQREAEQDRLEEQALETEQDRQDAERIAQGEDPEAGEDPEDGDGDESDGTGQDGEGGSEGGETEQERAAREEAERQDELDKRNEFAHGGGGDGSDGSGPDGDSEDGEGGEGPGGSGPPRSNW